MNRADVKQRALAIARDLHALAASSYGPTGRVKVLQPNEDAADAVEVTTVAERILRRLGAFECPVATVHLHILNSRVWNHCDGGLFTLLLSAKLQLAAHDGALSNIPPQLVIQGFHLALDRCLAYLEDPSCPIRIPIDWSSTVALFAVLRGILSAKAVATSGTSADDALAFLVPLLVETFVSVLSFVTEHPGESLPIRFVHDSAYASSLHNSRLLKNAVVLDLQHHTADAFKLLPLTNASVLLFSISLDPARALWDTEDDNSNGILVRATTSDRDPDDEAALCRLGDAILATGAHVVISQKLIPSFLQDYLTRRGVLTIQRLGITHMRAVQLLTGATALGDWRTTTIAMVAAASMGFLSSVRAVRINHHEHLLLENDAVRSAAFPRSWPVATLVLAARNEHAYTELTHVISSCFKRLEAMMEDPVALAGAGCTEIHLAAWLRRHRDHLVVDREAYTVDGIVTTKQELATLRRMRTVIGAFADALEAVVVTLDHGVHGLADEVVQRMRDANHATLHALPETPTFGLFGWDPVRGEPFEVATVAQRQDSSDASSTRDSDSSSNHSDDDDDEEEESRALVAALVLDSLAVKRDALMTAVECATTLLRVGGVLHTSP